MDPDMDSIGYGYGYRSDIQRIPDTDRIFNGYKYEYEYISNIK
jgi:hypothetical protein